MPTPKEISLRISADDMAIGKFRALRGEIDATTAAAARNAGVVIPSRSGGGGKSDAYGLASLRAGDGRSDFEQQVRDELAARAKIVRDLTRKQQVKDAADKLQYGPTQQDAEIQWKRNTDRETTRNADVQRRMDQTRGANKDAFAELASGRSTPLNANKEASDRFKSTRGAAEDAGKGFESFTDKALKVGLALHAVKAAAILAGAGISLLDAMSADVGHRFEDASKGYMQFAEGVKSIPIVGEAIYKIADSMSKKPGLDPAEIIADAKKIDAHNNEMILNRVAANKAADQQIRADRIAALKDPWEREKAGDYEAHRLRLDQIKEEVKERKIGADKGKELAEAENAKFNANRSGKLDNRSEAYQVDYAQEEARRLRSIGDVAKAERTEYLETLRVREAAAEKISQDELRRVKEIDAAEVRQFDARQAYEKGQEEYARRERLQNVSNERQRGNEDDEQRISDMNSQAKQTAMTTARDVGGAAMEGLKHTLERDLEGIARRARDRAEKDPEAAAGFEAQAKKEKDARLAVFRADLGALSAPPVDNRRASAITSPFALGRLEERDQGINLDRQNAENTAKSAKFLESLDKKWGQLVNAIAAAAGKGAIIPISDATD